LKRLKNGWQKLKKKVRNYTFQITLCDDCLEKFEKHFRNTSEWIGEIPEHHDDECDLCKKKKRIEPLEYLPLE
jgi:hypothetical protein